MISEIQLKLWEVGYTRRGSATGDTAMVLSETKERAEYVITKAVQTFGNVTAIEIIGPFANGRILTTTVSSL